MFNIIKYITENKIFVLLLIIVCIIIYFYIYPQINVEKMEGGIPIGQAVYLTYIDSVTKVTNYLAFIDTKECTNSNPNMCETGAVLQPNKDLQSVFILNQLIGQTNVDSYFITSKKKNLKLVNKLNTKIKPSLNLCLEQTLDTVNTSFNITHENDGYILWVNKKILNPDGSVVFEPYYVSKSTDMCNTTKGNLSKLSLINNKQMAIVFNFELAIGENKIVYNIPVGEQEHSIQERIQHLQERPTQEHPMPEQELSSHFAEPFENISNFSLFSQDTQSQCDTMSLPGQDGVSDFASWSDNNSLLN